MKGHVRRRGKASWAVILDFGRDGAGKRRQKWHSVKGTRKNAESELARLLNELRVGEYVEMTKMLLRDYLERWLRDYAKPRVSPRLMRGTSRLSTGRWSQRWAIMCFRSCAHFISRSSMRMRSRRGARTGTVGFLLRPCCIFIGFCTRRLHKLFCGSFWHGIPPWQLSRHGLNGSRCAHWMIERQGPSSSQ